MILALFLLTLAIGLQAQWHVKRAYARHSRTPVQSGYTVGQRNRSQPVWGREFRFESEWMRR